MLIVIVVVVRSVFVVVVVFLILPDTVVVLKVVVGAGILVAVGVLAVDILPVVACAVVIVSVALGDT